MIKGQRVWVEAVVDALCDSSVTLGFKDEDGDVTDFVYYVPKKYVKEAEPETIKGKVVIEYDLDNHEVLSVKPMGDETKVNLADYLHSNIKRTGNYSKEYIQELITVFNEV